MPLIQIREGVLPSQVENFPAGAKRTASGPLYIRPGVVEVTQDELDHIKRTRKDLASYIVVMPQPRPVKTPKSLLKAEEKAPAAVSDKKETETVEAPEKPKTKGKPGRPKGEKPEAVDGDL